VVLLIANLRSEAQSAILEAMAQRDSGRRNPTFKRYTFEVFATRIHQRLTCEVEGNDEEPTNEVRHAIFSTEFPQARVKKKVLLLRNHF
jgi:hypothetical protein